jgi:hypothetical protein
MILSDQLIDGDGNFTKIAILIIVIILINKLGLYKPHKRNNELKNKKQDKSPTYPSMDEQVLEFADIIVTHLLNNPQLWK